MSGWQAINSAPKDGTSVLLYWPDLEDITIGHWIDQQTLAYGKETSRSQHWYRDHLVTFFHDRTAELRPSHWMPLPEVPTNELEASA